MSKIPKKKHTSEQLSRMRVQGAMQANNSQIVNAYNKQLANKLTTFIGYLLPLIAILWWIVKKMQAGDVGILYEVPDFFIMTIPIILALLIALWIAVKRVLSRHNSAFISILAVLCCFPVIVAVNSDEVFKANLLALIGKDIPISEQLLVNEEGGSDLSKPTIRGVISDSERDELLRYEKQLKIEKATREDEKRRMDLNQ